MKTRVTVVFLLACAISGTLVYLLINGGGNLLARRATVYTYVADTAGLTEKSPVRLSGIEIGKVKTIRLSDSGDQTHVVRIELRVLASSLKGIPSDSLTSIDADTLIGGQYVAINTGKSPVPVADSGTLGTIPIKGAAERADLIRSIQASMQRVDDLSKEITDPHSPIGQVIYGDNEYMTALTRITAFSRAVHAFVSPDSQIGQALFSTTLYDELRAPIRRVDDAMAAIQRGEGTLGKAFVDDSQYEELVSQFRDVHRSLSDLRTGKGAYAGLLKNDDLWQSVARLLSETDATIDSLTLGDGQIARLYRDPQMYESLNGSLQALQTLLKDIREHPEHYQRYKR